MIETPERIWAWCFQVSEHGGWGNWGGYARKDNRHALDDRERESGAEYIRADLFDAVKAERDDELLNIARQAGYQDGAEDRRKLEARVKALTEALDERQDSGRDFWMKWTQKRLETRNAMFLRDAKLALDGDMRALRTRVEMMEAEPMQIVLSAALQENTDDR